jgi:hypothetical protein
MRIISQNNRIDLPYGEFGLARTQDNCIVAMRNVADTPDNIVASVIAKYSTEEKAMRAMEMLREEYRKIREYETDYMGFAFDPPKVFQFPQDSEV